MEDSKQYRKQVGKLQCLTITTAFVVSKLAQYYSAPRDGHLQAVHNVLKYLKGTIGQSLFYGAYANFDLRGYSDSDWGAYLDTRRLVTGYAMFIGDSLIFWKAKNKQTVSTSSAEAEYLAMCIATKEII